MQTEELKSHIRDVPDFPKPGIVFKDITTLLQNPKAFSDTLQILYDRYKDKKIEVVTAIEARGFIFGGALAQMLGVGFVPVRKAGKLPYKTYSAEYELEYASSTMEIHVDAIKKGLEPSSHFDAVTISSANLDRTGNRVKFEMKLQRVGQ